MIIRALAALLVVSASCAIERIPTAGRIQCSVKSVAPPTVSVSYLNGRGRAQLSTGIPVGPKRLLVAWHGVADRFVESRLEQLYIDGVSTMCELLEQGAQEGILGDWALLEIRGFHDQTEARPLDFGQLTPFLGSPKELAPGTELVLIGYHFVEEEGEHNFLKWIEKREVTVNVVARERTVRGESPGVIFVVNQKPGGEEGLSGGPAILKIDGRYTWIGTSICRDEQDFVARFFEKEVFSFPIGERRLVILPAREILSSLSEEQGTFPALGEGLVLPMEGKH